MPDLDEAGRQHVQEEPAQELHTIQGHHSLTTLVVPVAEGDPSVIDSGPRPPAEVSSRSSMAMFDHYHPTPPLPCPQCGAPLDGWQGKSGPCGLFAWIQGCSAPSRQHVDDAWAMPEPERSALRLPELFEIHTACKGCGAWIEAEGSCEAGVWTGVDFVAPLEPPGLPEGWRAIRGDERLHVEREIRREVPPGHVLHGASFTPLARRASRDDVLVRAGRAPRSLYLVHLTWREETDPAWPATRPFRTLADFAGAEEDR